MSRRISSTPYRRLPDRGRRRFALHFLLGFAAAALFVGPSPALGGSGSAEGCGPGRHQITLLTTDGSRRYIAHAPQSYSGVDARPVVVALHGSGGDANSFIDETNWCREAEQNGFIVVAPEGLPLRPNLPAVSLANPRLWNSGQFSSIHPHGDVDDVGFIMACLDDARGRWLIDDQRTYVVGYSSGGSMAYRLVCERGDRFAGMASVGGLCWVDNPAPPRPVPTLAIHGSLDPLVPLTGGVKVLPWDMRPTPPVGAAHRRWAAAIGSNCEARDLDWAPAPGVSARDYGPGPGGAVLRSYHVKGQGHAWPGGSSRRVERFLGPNLSSFDATNAIWVFLSQWAG